MFSVATSLPVMARYHPRLVGLSLSVPVLMLKVPAIKINVESHDATGRHARDQSPGNTEDGVRFKPV